MYLFGFAGGWLGLYYRSKKEDSGWTQEEVSDVVFYLALGVILGARLGYSLFYNPVYYAKHPLEILYIWQGGMSYHGGMLGTLVAIYFFARARGKGLLQAIDFLVPVAPIGLFFGRIGNFINQELWGKVSDVPWAMVFKGAGPLPRHPSQLYESFLEGAVLFAIVWWFSSRKRPAGSVFGLYLMGYGLFRSLVEFVRVPDAHIGYLAFDWVTMGHVLSFPMFIIGALLFYWSYWKEATSNSV